MNTIYNNIDYNQGGGINCYSDGINDFLEIESNVQGCLTGAKYQAPKGYFLKISKLAGYYQEEELLESTLDEEVTQIEEGWLVE